MSFSTDALTGDLQISLRAWPSDDPNANSLPPLIERINKQRGDFRNITEQSLEQEIRDLELGHADQAEENGEVDIKKENVDRLKEIQDARQDILSQIGLVVFRFTRCIEGFSADDLTQASFYRGLSCIGLCFSPSIQTYSSSSSSFNVTTIKAISSSRYPRRRQSTSFTNA
jgi:mediator of RNA polymerase II transcription subunit 17